jgi:hypothetical protein
VSLTHNTPVVVEFEEHDGQLEVATSAARFRVVACGRRWGKTLLASMLALEHALENEKALVWWVAPIYKQTKIAMRMFLVNIPAAYMEVNRTDNVITFPHNGSRIAFLSGDNPATLRGEGVDLLVVDECAFVKEEAWEQALRPTLSDTGGKALLIGTFNGMNFFYDLYQRGQDPAFSEWESWRFTTAENPHIPLGEVDEARRTLPREIFEQEYESSPLSYAGAVFYGESVQQSVDKGAGIMHNPELPTYAGLDWGYHNTALEICQETADSHVRWIDEHVWQGYELNERCRQIAEYVDRYSIQEIYADAAGATEIITLSEYLRETTTQCSIQPVPFNKFKTRGIEVRRYYLERGLEAMSTSCHQLAHDTRIYHYKEDSEDVEKVDDHTVDAATAYYATREMGRIGD